MWPTTNILLIPGSVVSLPEYLEVWSVASTQALIEVQLRLQLYKQLHWRLALSALQAELRVLQCHRTWAVLFHVCHWWQPERHILARCVLETCLVTWNIHLLACSPAVGTFIHQIFLRYLWPVQMRHSFALEMIPSPQPVMGGLGVGEDGMQG